MVKLDTSLSKALASKDMGKGQDLLVEDKCMLLRLVDKIEVGKSQSKV